MAKPVIFTIDDDPEVLRAIERDLRQGLHHFGARGPRRIDGHGLQQVPGDQFGQVEGCVGRALGHRGSFGFGDGRQRMLGRDARAGREPAGAIFACSNRAVTGSPVFGIKMVTRPLSALKETV